MLLKLLQLSKMAFQLFPLDLLRLHHWGTPQVQVRTLQRYKPFVQRDYQSLNCIPNE